MEDKATRKTPFIFTVIGIVILLGLAAITIFLFLTGDGTTPAQSSPLPTIAAVAIPPTVDLQVMDIVETAVSTKIAITPTVTPTMITHTVHAGETMYAIAQKYGMDFLDLITLNAAIDPNALDVGQIIQVNIAEGVEIIKMPIPDAPTSINGVPITQLVSMDAAALQTARTIFARGQEMGRNPNAFSKAGDSTIELPHFLGRFDEGGYDLADFAYLQPTIDQYQGSFARDSAAVRVGMHSWTMLDPAWADKSVCLPNETAVSCEIRLHNPSIMLVRLGANDDAGAVYFDEQMRLIVEAIIAEGVIPIVGTKSDRAEGSDINNSIIRQIASDYHLPIWDFDRLADTLPARGLDVDYAHMSTFHAHDYTNPTAFTRGHSMHNLTALILLDVIWQEITDGG